jgi:DNA polymerase-1
VTKTLSDFEEVVFVDFEFVAKPGERPDVVCLALSSGQTYCLWRDQLGDAPPYRIDDRTLFVSFVANTELGCHLNLDWSLPVNVLDLNPEFRRITNGRTVPEGKGLLGALAYYGLDSIGSKRKDAMRDRIKAGWPFTVEEREEILRYGASDVDALVRLLPKMLPDTNLDLALHRSESVAVLAIMEHRGVPIDREIFSQLTDKQAWRYVRDAMVPVIDAAYGVYVRGPDDDWHFSMEKFEAYLDREGIVGWPRTEKGKLSTSTKVFENMCKGHPQLENLRQLRHARNKMRKIKLAVGADFRNRTVLWPFKAKSSRPALRGSCSIRPLPARSSSERTRRSSATPTDK